MYHSECLWNTTPGHSAVKNANTDSSNYYSNNKHTATSNIYNMTAYANTISQCSDLSTLQN